MQVHITADAYASVKVKMFFFNYLYEVSKNIQP